MLKEFIYNLDNKPTNNCHASTVLPLENGDILSAWFGGTKEGNDDVDIYVSKRTQSGWSKALRISADEDIPHWNPVLFAHLNGDISLFFKAGKKISSWQTYVVKSTDNGETWSEPVQLVKNDESAGRGPVKNKCIRLENGFVLAPASTENPDWVCFVDLSLDDGLSWIKQQIITCNSGSNETVSLIQPTLWQDDKGIIHAYMRSNVGKIYHSQSADGSEWSQAEATFLPNNNSGIDLVRVENGDLYLVSNPISENWGERTPLTLSVSHDNAETWKCAMVLEDAPGEYSYPAIEARNDELYITYTYNREAICYVKVSIRNL